MVTSPRLNLQTTISPAILSLSGFLAPTCGGDLNPFRGSSALLSEDFLNTSHQLNSTTVPDHLSSPPSGRSPFLAAQNHGISVWYFKRKWQGGHYLKEQNVNEEHVIVFKVVGRPKFNRSFRLALRRLKWEEWNCHSHFRIYSTVMISQFSLFFVLWCGIKPEIELPLLTTDTESNSAVFSGSLSSYNFGVT